MSAKEQRMNETREKREVFPEIVKWLRDNAIHVLAYEVVSGEKEGLKIVGANREAGFKYFIIDFDKGRCYVLANGQLDSNVPADVKAEIERIKFSTW